MASTLLDRYRATVDKHAILPADDFLAEQWRCNEVTPARMRSKLKAEGYGFTKRNGVWHVTKRPSMAGPTAARPAAPRAPRQQRNRRCPATGDDRLGAGPARRAGKRRRRDGGAIGADPPGPGDAQRPAGCIFAITRKGPAMDRRTRKRVVEFRGHLAGPEHVGELDQRESEEVGLLALARLGDCYRNALRSATFIDGEVLYVEGYGVLHGVPLEHGWLVVDGKVIDPTVAAFRDGIMFERYVPVLVWSLKDMAAQAAQQGALPLGDWFIGGWETGTLKREDVAGAWHTTALRLAGYSGTAQDFHKEVGL